MRRLNLPLSAPLAGIICGCALFAPVSGHAQSLSTPGVGVWWSASSAPVRFNAPSDRLTRSLSWTTASAGVEWTELDMVVGGGPLRVRAILVRFRPDRFVASLVQATDGSRVRGVWVVDSAAEDVAIAVNAGQFAEAGPWGWIVRDGLESAPPGSGPLAAAIAFTRSGAVRWLDGTGITGAQAALGGGRAPRAGARAAANGAGADPIETAFQSYPRLLAGGSVPSAIRTGTGVDARHRDARLALGQLRDGRILLALTRFGERESAVSRIPIGLTLAETAALMGSLGCADAMMLDGGLSAQMFLRPSRGEPIMWRGVRRVPVALVFRRR